MVNAQRSHGAGTALDAEALGRRRDGELVRACRSGDEGAWEMLVHRFSSYVHAILTRAFELSDTAAEDVFQEVFVTVFRRLPTLDDDEAIKPWIAQLARRKAIDRLRATRPTVDLDGVPELAAEDPELESIEEAVAVQRALAELPEPYHEVVERFFVRDESYRTIAAELGIASGTVASRVSRGLAMLRDLLEGAGMAAASAPDR